MAGYGTKTKMINVVAFATVDAEIALTPPTFLLTVQGEGDGAGTVTNGLGDINCTIDGANDSGACSSDFLSGTQVTLTANPSTGSTFDGWSDGGCSGTGACSVTMDQAHTVTATFTLDKPINHTLSVNKPGTGSGVVTSSPSGISCGADCTHDYVAGTTVTLTADPTAGSAFVGWSGAGCSGTGNCTVTMDQARTVTADFAFIPLECPITVDLAGDGSGTVSSSPTGINCGTDCFEGFICGTTVTLTALPFNNSIFSGWSGGGCSGTGPCTVTLGLPQTVTATFTLIRHTLDVTKSGAGSGVVTSSPSGINCGTVCSQDYITGTEITLSADPTGGSTFTGWSGGGCSGTGTCTVIMSQDYNVSADFTIPINQPTISNIGQKLVALNDGRCTNWNGVVYSGTIFGISFDYEDPNGDAHKSQGATVDMGFDMTPWSTFTGDGFNGSVTGNRCVGFSSNAPVNIPVTLTDGEGNESNTIVIGINKPEGYDECHTYLVQANSVDGYSNDTRSIDLGQNSGTFQLDIDTFGDGADQIVVRHDNEIIFDSECIENKDTIYLTYSGSSTEIDVEVGNCSGNSMTWEYTVYCPN